MHLNSILHTKLLSCNSSSVLRPLTICHVGTTHVIGCIFSNAKLAFQSFPTFCCSPNIVHYKIILYPAVGDACTQISGLADDITCQHDIASTRRQRFNVDRVSVSLLQYNLTQASLITRTLQPSSSPQPPL